MPSILPSIMDKIPPLIETKAHLDLVSAFFDPEAVMSNRHFQLLRTVFAIADQSAKADDSLLKAYVDNALANIRAMEATSDVDALQSTLSRTLHSVSSTEVRAVKQYMTELIQKAAQCGFSGKRYRDKVASIQEALSRMPPETRGTVLYGEKIQYKPLFVKVGCLDKTKAHYWIKLKE